MTVEDASGLYIRVPCTCGRKLKLLAASAKKALACPACNRAIRCISHDGAWDPPEGQALFMIEKGPRHVGRLLVVGGRQPIEVGKVPEADLRLVDGLTSRKHCRFVPALGGWSVVDNKSTNGLYVNGERVQEYHLFKGDRVQVGEFELRFLGPLRQLESPPVGMGNGVLGIADGPAAVIGEDEGLFEIRDDGQVSAFELERQEREAAFAASAGGPVRGAVPGTPQSLGPGIVCPCCSKQLTPGAKFCVACGINARTGRAVITADEVGLERTYTVTWRIIWVISFLFPGFFPFASEALRTRKPWTVRSIAIITAAISAWFLCYDLTGSNEMRSYKYLMLWPAEASPTDEMLEVAYKKPPDGMGNYADARAFHESYRRISEENPDWPRTTALREAHNSLSPEKRYNGEFRWYQLFTHAFLHAGPIHFLGNLLFLMVFGARVNAALGNMATIIVYPILAASAAAVHLASEAGGPPVPMLGASGAIMGLAGMYFVLFPIHKVHMVAWWRWGWATGFHLSWKMWPVRGFWVVLAYFAIDAGSTILRMEDGTAHWAHMGGFAVGAVLALLLLVTRLAVGRGADLASVMLGKYAWPIVGKPNRDKGWLQKLP